MRRRPRRRIKTRDGFLFGLVWSWKVSYKRPCGCFMISLTGEMATKPGVEFVLSPRRKDRGQGKCLDSLNGRQREFRKGKGSRLPRFSADKAQALDSMFPLAHSLILLPLMSATLSGPQARFPPRHRHTPRKKPPLDLDPSAGSGGRRGGAPFLLESTPGFLSQEGS